MLFVATKCFGFKANTNKLATLFAMSQYTASHFPRVIPTFANLLDSSSSRAGLYNLAKRAQSWLHGSRQSRSLVLNLEYDVHSGLNTADEEAQLFTIFNEPSHRVVVVYSKRRLELRSVLEQVRGGPLEKVHEKKDRDSHLVEIHFLSPHDAQEFYNYCTKTRFFLVNGSRLWVEWDLSYKKRFPMPMLIPPFVLNQINMFGASRCLLITKPMFGKHSKRIGSHMFYPQPPRNFLYEHLNFEELRNELEQYGSVVDITPMVSVNVSFCVHFADIRSAILVKKDVEKPGTPANKAFASLTVAYHKDPCDQKCYVL